MGFAGGVDSVAGDTVADSKSDSGYSRVNESGGRDAVSKADVDRDSATRSAANQKAIDKAKEIADQKAREATVAKAKEERLAREAADKVVADQKARDAAIQATEDAKRKAAADRAAALKYMQEQAPSTGPTGRGGVAVQKGIEAVIDKATGKIITVESKGDPNAQNPNSSAAGLGQFTKGTWLATVGKYRPDLMVGRTEAEVLGLRTDPAISVEMTRNLTKENAAGLEASGFPVNESTLYLSHFLGLGGAKKMLNAAADTPASAVVGEDAATANPTILGGTKTAADVLSWASKKMGGAASYDVAGVTSTSPTRGITVDAGGKEADLPAVEGTPVGASIGVGGFGRLPPAPEPTSWYDKLVSVFDSTPQIEALEDQNRLAGGLTKQEYADQFAGGDSTKVNSRIVDYGQGPQVDYYSKSLGDKFGEAASDLGKGFSNAGKGITSLLGIPTGTGDASYFGDIPTAVPQTETGFGPGGDLTREQYNEQYGGSDIATNLPPTGTPTTPTTPKTPVVPPVVPTGPVMPTAPNFATAQRYTGTPTVATQGFDFSRPFAPRPSMDFANLGQAYAPTALSTAPPPQPLQGIPGALYSTPYQRLG